MAKKSTHKNRLSRGYMIVCLIGSEYSDITKKAKAKLADTISKIMKESNYVCSFVVPFPNAYWLTCTDVINSLSGNHLSVCLQLRFSEKPNDYYEVELAKKDENYLLKKRNNDMIDNSRAAIFFGTEDECVQSGIAYAQKKKKTVYIM